MKAPKRARFWDGPLFCAASLEAAHPPLPAPLPAQVLCALASGGGRRRAWLLDAGILPLLHRLTMERARDVAGTLYWLSALVGLQCCLVLLSF